MPKTGSPDAENIDRNLTATGCLSLSPCESGIPNKSVVLSLRGSGCRHLFLSRADSLSGAREAMPPGVLRAAHQEH